MRREGGRGRGAGLAYPFKTGDPGPEVAESGVGELLTSGQQPPLEVKGGIQRGALREMEGRWLVRGAVGEMEGRWLVCRPYKSLVFCCL